MSHQTIRKIVILIFIAAAIGGAIFAFVYSGGQHQQHKVAAQKDGMLFYQPRIFAAVPGSTTTAGYLTIVNNSGTKNVLTSVVARFAEKTEIHDTTNDNGVFRMRPLPNGLPIADGESVEFSTGGKHLMFINITDTAAKKMPVVFFFSGGQKITVDFMITKRGGDSHVH